MAMYIIQLFLAVNEDTKTIDSNELFYLVPIIILILGVVYLIRIRVFDRIYGFDLSELERENISPFSSMSDKEYQEIKEFRQDEETEEEVREDYYVKL